MSYEHLRRCNERRMHVPVCVCACVLCPVRRFMTLARCERRARAMRACGHVGISCVTRGLLACQYLYFCTCLTVHKCKY